MNISIQTGKVPNFTASRQTGWFAVNFPSAFSTVPTVYAQIQTFRGPDSPGIRIQNVTEHGFEVRMDELFASGSTSSTQGSLGTFSSDGRHPAPEILGWIAIG